MPDNQPDLDARLAAGRALARDGQGAAAIGHFRGIVADHPDDPRAHFELAGAFDSQGYAEEAVGPYRRAMALGLAGDDVPRWYVQFGSTLRNVGETDEAVQVLTEGRARFPDDAAIQIFQALALHSAGRDRTALVALLDLVVSAADAPLDLRHYRRAIGAYTDDLRRESS